MPGLVATRLTCFAVLSAVESDLREAIEDCAGAGQIVDLLPEDARANALVRWEKDSGGGAKPNNDLELLLYVDFADLAKILRRLQTPCWHGSRERTLRLAQQLDNLTPARNRVCHSRPLEPEDFPSLLDFARELPTAFDDLPWKDTTTTLQRLEKDPRFVLGLTIPPFWAAGIRLVPHNLPLPDFDETGFLGRTKDRRDLTKLILSAHPVVSVLGGGGVGKTALLLRCLYDLLESPTCEWDALVWISLKTKTLTSSGARAIESAVTSTLGVLEAAATALGAPEVNATIDDYLEEVRQYLAQFRVILAVDNLETLSREALRALLSDVPRGSKVVLTSRVGLGEIELRYPLESLDERTAIALARRYAQVLNLRTFSESPDDRLRKIVERLFFNPLLVKWFVSGVASGSDPKRLLDRRGGAFGDAMRFCVENLFQSLSSAERRVVHTMASVHHPVSQSELLFLLPDVSKDDLDWALNVLQQASIVERLPQPKTLAGAFHYALGEMPAEFVAQVSPPSKELFGDVQKRLRELKTLVEEGRVRRETYRYDPAVVHAVSRDEKIAGAYLRRAIEAHGASDFDEARSLIEHAREMTPQFSEVFRVSALVEAQRDPYRAAHDFETALELDPKSSLALFNYAQFLLRELDDYERALGLIERAIEIDGPDPALRTNQALALVRLGKYAVAAAIYEELLGDLPARDWKKWRVSTVDQAAECYRRWSEQAAKMADLEQADRHLVRALEILNNAFGRRDTDEQLVRRLARVLDERMFVAYAARTPATIRETAAALNHHWDSVKKLVFRNLERFRQACTAEGITDLPQSGATLRNAGREESAQPAAALKGAVTSVGTAVLYGFIRDDAGQEWFFHRKNLGNPDAYWRLRVGDRVTFRVGSNRRGPCAVDIVLDGAPAGPH